MYTECDFSTGPIDHGQLTSDQTSKLKWFFIVIVLKICHFLKCKPVTFEV